MTGSRTKGEGMNVQYSLFDESEPRMAAPQIAVSPFTTQLLKWVGNKQRFAHEIISYFPTEFGRYIEPFLGSGAVMATLAPPTGTGSDTFEPLIQIFKALQSDPGLLKQWYSDRFHRLASGEKTAEYEKIKASYNADPNPADLLMISRACYGGVVRFRKEDGYISTPVGPHNPISPASFSRRVDEWHRRMRHVQFLQADFADVMSTAQSGDVVYCDPPYTHSQGILYGAQDFELVRLFQQIDECKSRGVFVALSIDGTKKSGNVLCDLPIPDGLFEHEVFVNVGRSMLKRFQMNGRSLEKEVVRDRLLLTF